MATSSATNFRDLVYNNSKDGITVEAVLVRDSSGKYSSNFPILEGMKTVSIESTNDTDFQIKFEFDFVENAMNAINRFLND